MTTIAMPSVAGTPDEPPPNSTDHGVNASTFPTLWSGDVDGRVEFSNDSGPRGQLAARTDVPFDSPPTAVARWNRGDHAEFPATNDSTSIHPPDASLTDGVVIKDAYVELFAIQPSTRVRLTPDDQPHYVAPNGTVRATVDYRLDRPPVPNATVDWEHRIDTVRLLVDGEVVDSSTGSHTPTLAYTFPDSYRDGEHTITIEAEIEATPTVTALECNNDNRTCTPGSAVSAERLTVRDSVTVTPYDLTVSGFRARYPNGDLGLVLFKSKPWLGYRLPGGDVRGVWRFYTARDADWDTLVYSTDDGTATVNSTLVPLRVYAYPIETGPTPSPRGDVTIIDAFGDTREPPSLPSAVNLDVLTQPYTASFGLATRIDADRTTTPFADDDIRTLGLVRGVSTTPSESAIIETPIDRANLTLSVVNRSDDSLTVHARLVASESGQPIGTRDRDGYLVIAGERFNTTVDGTVTATLPRQDGTVSGRFVPGPWWLEDRGYTAASDAVYVDGTIIHFVQVLYRISVPVTLFFGAVFLIDRITGWHLWPPWRRL